MAAFVNAVPVLPTRNVTPATTALRTATTPIPARTRTNVLPPQTVVTMGAGGLFEKLKKAVLSPLVSVPGSGAKGDVIDCVFCNGTGVNDCTGCNGEGVDALGTCMMCNGKTYLTCTVCSGVGTVDKIRRGGTDDNNQYTANRKKRATKTKSSEK